MNNLISNFINLSIGICLESYSEIKNTLDTMDNEVNKLKVLGEKEKTEQILQIEELLKKILRDSKKLEGSIQEKIIEINNKIQNDLANLSGREKDFQRDALNDLVKSKISEMQELSTKNQTKKSKKTRAA